MRHAFWSLLLTAACAAPRANPPPPSPPPSPPSSIYTFEGVEVFGARRTPKDELLRQIGLPAPGTKIDMEKGDLGAQLIASKQRLLARYTFPFVRYSLVAYPEPRTARVTIDLVEADDEWRMRFNTAPTGDMPDPGGLIAAWGEYLQALWKLQREGAVPSFGEGTCRALGCFGGFGHPQLAPLEPRFIEGVPRHFDELVAVLRTDKDAPRRMHAAMLLSYAPSREAVVKAALPSVRDPDSGVRNEVLRLLGNAQHGADRVIVPLEPILEALWFPLSTDRNKAGWALVRIVEVERDAHRCEISSRAGEALAAMAAMSQRTDSEPAILVLKAISVEDHGHDEAAWRQWQAHACDRASEATSPAGAGTNTPTLPAVCSVPLRIPLGIADSPGRTGIVQAEDGGIDALDLETGKVLWHASEPTLPLGIGGGRVIAGKPRLPPGQRWDAKTLELLFLDERTGKPLRRGVELTFPEWAVVGEQEGSWFFATTTICAAEATLSWHAGRHYVGGANPGAQRLEELRIVLHGTARVDLSGRVLQAPAVQKRDTGLDLSWSSEAVQVGPHGLTLSLTLEPGSGGPRQIHLPRVLRAVSPDGKVRWERRVRTAVVYPPRA